MPILKRLSTGYTKTHNLIGDNMKNLILTAIVLISYLFLGQAIAKDKTITKEQQSILDERKWIDEFNEYLISHTDVDLNIMGYNKELQMRVSGTDEISDFHKIEISQILNDIVEHDKLTSQSLMLVSYMCTFELLDEKCQTNKIHNKLIQSSPKNLSVYLYAFNRAVKEGNHEQIAGLIDLMSETEYSHLYFSLSRKFEITLNEFAKIRPFPENSLVDELNVLKRNSKFSKPMYQNMLNNPDKYALFNYLMAYKYSLPIPAYRSLTVTCKETAELSKPCKKIAEILINNSHTLIGTLIGHAIKVEVLTAGANQQKIDAAILAQEKIRTEYDCLSKSMYSSEYSMDNLFDVEIIQVGLEYERNKGEYASIKKRAELIYQKQLEQGNEEAFDPELCYVN